MADKEPYKWITVKGAHIPVYKNEYGEDVFGVGEQKSDRQRTLDEIKTGIRNTLKKKLSTKYDKASDLEVDIYMPGVENMLDDFENKEFVKTNDEGEILFRFSGKDSEGEYASFEFGSRDEKKALEDLHANGYTVSRGMMFPTNIYAYVSRNTNGEKEDVMLAQILSKEVLQRYKKGNKI